jgi:transposase
MGVHLDGSIGVGVSRLEVIEGPSGRRRRTKAERARIAAESLMSGAKVTDVARRHGTSRWQVYDWRRQLLRGQLVLPENAACLPVFAELVVDDAAGSPPAVAGPDLEIVVGDVVIRASAGADEGQLTRAIRAARAAAS